MINYDDKISIKLHYPTVPVVFLHAFPVNRRMWQPQMDFLKKLGVGYVAWDYPGFGKSKIIKETMGIRDYSEYAYKILQEIGIRKAIFVGSSMGGYVALSLFREHPELFMGLLLANTRAYADDEEIRRRRYEIIEDLKVKNSVLELIEMHIQYFLTEETRGKRIELVKRLMEMMREATVEGVIQAQGAMERRLDSNDLLKRMKFPVTILSGDRDTLSPPTVAKDMVEMIPDATLKIVKNAAHLSNLERPKEFNRALKELIDKCH